MGKLIVAWWNAGISRVCRGQTKPTPKADKRLQFAPKIISNLVSWYGIDVFVLGEVSDDFGNCVAEQSGHVWKWGGHGDKRNGDMGCIIRSTSDVKTDKPEVISFPDTSPTFQARCVIFPFVIDKTEFTVFSAHLHSRKPVDQVNKRRDTAICLDMIIRNQLEQTKHVLVIGDFNDEPFDQSVSEILKSTRNRLACGKKNHLYNPCWRFLHDQEGQYGGTAKGNDQNAPRRAFDQVMMSAAFLQEESPLRFSDRCQIIEIADNMTSSDSKTNNKNCSFDHMPVLVEFEVTKNGE